LACFLAMAMRRFKPVTTAIRWAQRQNLLGTLEKNSLCRHRVEPEGFNCNQFTGCEIITTSATAMREVAR
jgi:hypothetical protein